MPRHGRSWFSFSVAAGAACVACLMAASQLRLGVAYAAPASATSSAWETCGRSLLKDGKAFFIRGVNYSPSPIGSSAGIDFLLKPQLWQRDLPLLRGMHANAIKVYFFDPSFDGTHNAFLDAAYNDEVDAIYTVFMVWIPPYLMEDWVPIDDSTFVNVVESFRLMARQTASHPGTMGYSIGGETNFQPAVQGPLYWQKFNTIAAAVRGELAAVDAKKILTTTYIDDGGTTNFLGESFNADVDIWGTDVYRGTISEVVLPAYRAVPGGKPLIFAEYGMSFASNNAAATDLEAQQISEQLTSYAAALESNFLGQDLVGEAIAAGGFVFSFSDEWWKDGNWFNHDFGSAPNPHYVLSINSEEFYGLFAVSKSPDPSQADILTPRPLVSMLTALWSSPIGGFSIAGCSATQPVQTSPPPSPTPTETTATPSPVTVTTLTPIATPMSGQAVSGTTPAPTPAEDTAAGSAYSTTSASREQSDAYERSAASSDATSSVSLALGSNVSAAQVPIRTCFVARMEQTLGIAAFFDASCNSSVVSNATNGCARNGCRFCRMFDSNQSASFQPCPSLASMANSGSQSTANGSIATNSSSGECATDTFQCATGLRVARDPHTNCSFVSCPDTPSDSTEIACDAGVGNLRLGVSMYHDWSCVASAGGLGCDQSRPGCRYCREVSWNSAAIIRVGSFLPCPSASVSTKDADDGAATNSSTNAPACLVSIGNANAGIGMLPDTACLSPTGGIGCAADQPGCRYCQLRLTWQSQHLLACSPVSLESASMAAQTLYGSSSASPSSAASHAAVGCAVVAAVVLAAVVVALALRAHRKRAKQRGRRHLSLSRGHSVL